MHKTELFKEYKNICQLYINQPNEEGLYKISLLSKKIHKLHIGPDELVQLHNKIQGELLEQYPPEEYLTVLQKLGELLVEGMIIYGAETIKTRDVLVELDKKYQELEEIEQALQTQLSFLNKLIQTIPNPIFYLDGQNTFQGCNVAFENFLGVSMEQLKGKPAAEVLPQKLVGDTDVGESILLVEPSTIVHEVQVQGKDKNEHSILLHKGSYASPKRSIAGIVGVLTDITELKQAKLQQEKLYKELSTTNKELVDFAFIVSHDLKTPLRGVAMLAQWLKDEYYELLGETGQEYIDLIQKRIQHLYDLIGGILEYSRAGRNKDDFSTINLEPFLDEIIDYVNPPEHITITIEKPLPQIRYVQVQLEQIFLNLINNAIKYNDKPQGTILIRAMDNNDFWRFAIKDNGKGIPEMYQETIFKLFRTLDSKEESGNTGIGLAIVKRIIERYGGTVSLESTAGEGSIFYFDIPKRIDDDIYYRP